MPPRRFKNPLHRFLFTMGHSPFELLEGVPCLLIIWILWLCLTGSGGFLEFGKPMIGVSYAILGLAAVHGAIVLVRKKSRSLDWDSLLPLPFLLLSLFHFLYLSPFPWTTALVLVGYIQAYCLYLIVLNSIRNSNSALFVILSCEFVVIAAVLMAFRQFYMRPGGWVLPGRMRYPEYAHGMAGYLQDPQTLASLILLIWPMTLMIAWMRRFPTPARVVNSFCAAIFPIGLLLSANRWGLLVFLVQLLAMPVFLTGEWWMRRRLWQYGLGLLVAALSVFWFTTEGLRQRMLYLLSNTGNPVDSGLLTGWRQFVDAPFHGQGMGTFGSLWDRFNPQFSMDSSLSSGSFLLDLLAGSGVVGMLLFLVPLLLFLVRAIPAWRAKLHVAYDQDVVNRFRFLPSHKRFRNKLVREQSRTPASKIFLGGLFPGLVGFLAYQVFDYSLRLPLHLFLAACLVSCLVVIGSDYKSFPLSGKLTRFAGLVPLGLAVGCCFFGLPRFSAQHLVYTANEQLQRLLADPELIFAEPGALDPIEADFSRACELNPGHGGAWIGLTQCRLAHLHVEKELPEEIALRTQAPLKEALKYSPLSWKVHYSTARVGILLGKTVDQVRPHLERAQELAPRRPEPEAFLGILLLRENRRSVEGRRLVEEALARYPDYPLLHLFQPWLELSDEQEDGAAAPTLNGSLVTPGLLARHFEVFPTVHESIRGVGLPAGSY